MAIFNSYVSLPEGSSFLNLSKWVFIQVSDAQIP